MVPRADLIRDLQGRTQADRMAVENFPIVIASSSPLPSEFTTNINVRNFRGARETRPNGIQVRWQSPARIASPIPFRVRGGDLTPPRECVLLTKAGSITSIWQAAVLSRCRARISDS
jgi:hypothetical protein